MDKYLYQKEAHKQAKFRQQTVKFLRKMQKTYKEIGLMLNVSPQRAKQIFDGPKRGKP